MIFGRRGAPGELRDEVSQLQGIEAALRKAQPGVSYRYQTLAHLHRQAAMLAGSLAVRLKLTPSSRLDRRLPHDGELPVR